jgi:ATP-dependent DNA helicase RecQ
MKGKDRALIRRVLAELLAKECLVRSDGKFPVLRLGAPARKILFEGERLTLHLGGEEVMKFAEPAAKPKRERRKAPVVPKGDLYECLRLLRAELAQQQNVPPYVIFSNVTLMEMAEKKPQSMEGMRRISGVGEVKAARYGEAFLTAIDAWRQEYGHSEAVGRKIVLPDIY